MWITYAAYVVGGIMAFNLSVLLSLFGWKLMRHVGLTRPEAVMVFSGIAALVLGTVVYLRAHPAQADPDAVTRHIGEGM